MFFSYLLNNVPGILVATFLLWLIALATLLVAIYFGVRQHKTPHRTLPHMRAAYVLDLLHTPSKVLVFYNALWLVFFAGGFFNISVGVIVLAAEIRDIYYHKSRLIDPCQECKDGYKEHLKEKMSVTQRNTAHSSV